MIHSQHSLEKHMKMLIYVGKKSVITFILKNTYKMLKIIFV